MARIKFFGVRGSVSVFGTQYQEFGGNTSCVLVEGPQRTVILDAGTGIRELGKEMEHDPHLGIDRPCFLAFSHFHWDHIQGLPTIRAARLPSARSAVSAAASICEASLTPRCRSSTFRSLSTAWGRSLSSFRLPMTT
jgi:phosphoribosyl 1,2-cyclic phosphodiesterase